VAWVHSGESLKGGYMLTPEIYSVASGIEDVLKRAALSDGISIVPSVFQWTYNSINATDQFNQGKKTLEYSKCQMTIEDEKAYENIIDLPRHIEIYPEYLRVEYSISDSVKGVGIYAILRIDISHPPEYLDALEAAGSIIEQTDKTLVIQCGI